MDEHPQYRMWNDRLHGEQALEEARASRQAEREWERANWYEAWISYKARRDDMGVELSRPRWWNLVGWIRWLLRLHAPGWPN